MKRTFQSFLFLVCVCDVFAQGTLSRQIVVPNAQATVEGNSSTSDPFTSSSFRMQMVFDASQFSIPPGASGRIDGISFRIDGAAGASVGYSFAGGSITASLTPLGPDGLSPIFANNVGANPVTIFSGAMAFGNFYQPGASPQPFGNPIGAQTPFWYMPSQGNLLLDIRAGGGQTIFPGGLDAQFGNGDSISRVYANSFNSLSGTADTLGLITHFDFTVIPEPSAVVLALMGAAISLTLRVKERKP